MKAKDFSEDKDFPLVPAMRCHFHKGLKVTLNVDDDEPKVVKGEH
jgi:hypothetical protein